MVHKVARPIKCFRERLNGKSGLFRNNLSGKRVDFSARTVIGPGAELAADEIEIPTSFAEKLTFPEKVFAHNIDQLTELVNNDKANYVIHPDGQKVNLKYKLYTKATYLQGGFEILPTDVIASCVEKDGKTVYRSLDLSAREKFKRDKGYDYNLKSTDKVIRDNKALTGFKPTERVVFEIESTDRILRDNYLLNPEYYLDKKIKLELTGDDKVFRPKKNLDIDVVYTKTEKYFDEKTGITFHMNNNMVSAKEINGIICQLTKDDKNRIDELGFKYRSNYTGNMDDFSRKEKINFDENYIELKQIQLAQKKKFEIKIGDVVERHLKNGDYVAFGRQPTLHSGSLIARRVKIIKENSSVNGHRPIRTIRMNLAATSTYNADFDGDEMNLYAVQTYQALAELQILSSTASLIKSKQGGQLLLCICQDGLTIPYLLTRGEFPDINVKVMKKEIINGIEVVVEKNYTEKSKKFNKKVQVKKPYFFDTVLKLNLEGDPMEKIHHIQNVLEWQGYTREEYLTGHGILSMILPNDFEYYCKPDEKNTKEEIDERIDVLYDEVKIVRGVLLCGVITKRQLGAGLGSITHKIEKDFGTKACIDFVSRLQWLANELGRFEGFSIGIKDCIPVKNTEIQKKLIESFHQVQAIKETEMDLEQRERKINNVLNNVRDVGSVISKKSVHYDNGINATVLSGGKGSFTNISQIVGCLGQQNVNGARFSATYGTRTLPHYLHEENLEDTDAEIDSRLLSEIQESKGFVSSSFWTGLNPQEFFFHCSGGRQGVTDSAIKTAKSGYIQRKLIKKMEDLVFSYQGVVVNAKNTIVKFNYGYNIDPSHLINVNGHKSFVNISNIANSLNSEVEFDNWNDFRENN